MTIFDVKLSKRELKDILKASIFGVELASLIIQYNT
jgi:hypothetical protein